MNYHLLTKYSLALHGVAPVFVLLSTFTLIVIALYSKNYLHEEKGKGRFWLLYTLFAAGISHIKVASATFAQHIG